MSKMNYVYQAGPLIAVDTVTYLGASFALREVVSEHYFEGIKPSSVVGFFIVDGIYYFLHDRIASWFKMVSVNATYLKYFPKFMTLTTGLVVIDWLMGHSRAHMLGSVIEAGIVTGISTTVFDHYAESIPIIL